MKRKVKTLVILTFLVYVLFSILFLAIHETTLEKNRQILKDNSDKYELYLDGEQIDSIDDVDLLFSESHGRYLVTVSEDAVDDMMDKINVPVSIIGEVKGETLKLNDLELEINELNDAFHGVLEKYMV